MSGRWIPVVEVATLEAGGVTTVRVGTRDYAVYDAPDGLYASLAYCTHAGAHLGDGYFDGHTIECPLHQGCFDVRTGAATGAPATRALQVFDTRVRDGMVELRLAGARGDG